MVVRTPEGASQLLELDVFRKQFDWLDPMRDMYVASLFAAHEMGCIGDIDQVEEQARVLVADLLVLAVSKRQCQKWPFLDDERTHAMGTYATAATGQ